MVTALDSSQGGVTWEGEAKILNWPSTIVGFGVGGETGHVQLCFCVGASLLMWNTMMEYLSLGCERELEEVKFYQSKRDHQG